MKEMSKEKRAEMGMEGADFALEGDGIADLAEGFRRAIKAVELTGEPMSGVAIIGKVSLTFVVGLNAPETR